MFTIPLLSTKHLCRFNIIFLFKNQVEYQRTLNEEKKSIMAAERAQLQNEISTLHEQLMDSENKLSLLHESSASRLKEEQRKHQQAIQLIQSENIKEQSRLKNDMQNIIQKLEVAYWHISILSDFICKFASIE